MTYQHYVQHYAEIDTASAIHAANPHQVIALLMQGFLTRVNHAKSAIEHKNFDLKNQKIKQAMDILTGLEDALNLKDGGDIATNLQALYQYMQAQLLTATARNDTSILDDMTNLMKQIKSSWDKIPEDIRNQPVPA